MVYITVKRAYSTHQMTLDELLFGANNDSNQNCFENSFWDTSLLSSSTVTRKVGEISDGIRDKINVEFLIRSLEYFNRSTSALRNVSRNDLYRTFYIPKKSGGLRRIDAPNDDLMEALRELKLIFERDFKALYHTSAFAYVSGRSTIDAMKRHQSNQSHWFAKFDLHDFFGSTTKKFLMSQLSMVFPFSEVVATENGRRALEDAVDLAFLNGGLPQGTPISPLLTNVMMIPIDYELTKALRDFDGKSFCFTRYADDFQISCKYNFDYKKVEKLIVNTLKVFQAPFYLNEKKTRYGSNTGRGANWNLGLMLNKDNNITVGRKKKRQLLTMFHNYVTDKRRGISWSYEDVCVLNGYVSYIKMIEPNALRGILKYVNEKEKVSVQDLIKADLRM